MCLWECNVFSLPCILGVHRGKQGVFGLSVKLEAVLCFVSWLRNCRTTLCKSRFITVVIVSNSEKNDNLNLKSTKRRIQKRNRSKSDHAAVIFIKWQIYAYKVIVRTRQQEQEQQQTLKAWMRSSLKQLRVIRTLLCSCTPVRVSIKLRSSASPYNKHSCNGWQRFILGSWC